jgi:CPA1 family monovalent cation:H+ antiporter
MTTPVLAYTFLFSIIVLLGYLFRKSSIPLVLILIVFGMLLSFIPYVPVMQLDSNLVLDVFLPLLIYEISAFSSWRDIKKQIRPIASLSIGHVVFITVVVAIVAHTLIPQMGWPLAFVLGAILSPPDDVAIVSICEKIRIPERIFIILEGEGMFNDAAALILFRFALAAAITHTFSFAHAFIGFLMVIVGETLYGFILGNLLGKIRKKITNPALHMIASILTPFLAYIPVVMLGGTGVLSTAVTGFLIGNQYSIRFTPEFRLISTGIWPMLGFAIQSLIFLLAGLDLRAIWMSISTIPAEQVILYVASIVAALIIGRFVWVYTTVLLFSRLLFPRDKTSQILRGSFLISWAGMRGGISLAAALAIPTLYFSIDGVDLRNLMIFIVLCAIIVTFVLQGLSLPYIMRKFGLDKVGQAEKYHEHLSELRARVQMINAAFEWLKQYKKEINRDEKLLEEVEFHINEYQTLLKKYKERISSHHGSDAHNEIIEAKKSTSLLLQIIKIEKKELLQIWREEKINLRSRNRLLSLLDHHVQRFSI